MNKNTLILIGNLNNLYNELFKNWSTQKGDDVIETQNKLKLIKTITKNIEEQKRGFLKSKLDYSKSGEYILDNINISYNDLHNGVTKILLN